MSHGGGESGDMNNDSNSESNGAPPNPSHKKLMKKSSSMYLNVRMPFRHARPSIVGEEEPENGLGDLNYDPTDKVQTLINTVRDRKHKTKQLFVEMDVLTQRGDELEWREWARWVKYEEKVEDGGKRWSKPHVASLNMHFLMEIRKCILEGVFLNDVECYSISQVVEFLLDAWTANGDLEPDLRQYIRTLCLRGHRHRHDKGRPEDKKKKDLKRNNTNSELRKQMSGANLEGMRSVASAISLSSDLERENSEVSLDSMDEDYRKRANDRFLRKIPKGAEVANVMVAGVEDLKTTLCGLVRLNDARILGDLSEVNLPTRFVFFLLQPASLLEEAQEAGRCLSTMLVDEVFREVAFKARNRNEIVAGIDEFLEQVTVLPPGEWDPKIRIEPPDSVPDQKFRKTPSKAIMLEGHLSGHGADEEEEEGHCDPDLVFSGRPFGGLVNDIKRKLPWYWSDFKDALHVQCLASFVYIFLATLTPNVTFGGMLGKETDQYMGVMECILAAAVTGIGFALFGGQPLNILGSTGPMLVLEQIIYQFCKDNEWEFLPFRFWIGIWTAGILLLIVALDLSALVRYITRFTEESFASLIAVIFIYEAFKKLGEIADEETPVMLDPSDADLMTPPCHCRFVPNDHSMSMPEITIGNTTLASMLPGQCESNATMMVAMAFNGTTEWHCKYVPDAFMFSIILFASTFFIATFLVDFRHWSCFPTFVRNILGDFAVLIAIVVMVGVDAVLGLPTPKLTVPDEFKPTNSEARDWVVDPTKGDNPWWLALAAAIPALLSTILIFMDQQITAVIVNRKENKLAKGKGYHLDLLVLAILVAVHSLLGLPWFVAATVSAIAHVNSLKKNSECTAPGEKPTFLGVREQRVTALLVGILSGLAVLITNILKIIPMPVLYGVFLFMGWSALKGMQFIDRILLLLMPVKYQPDYVYLRHVPLWRVHMFTLVQIVCLAALLVVKQIKAISIAFPLLVLFTGVVRKLMEWKFTQHELKYLDDILPSKKKGKGSKEAELERQSDAKISAIIANNHFEKHHSEGSNGNREAHFNVGTPTPEAGKPSFFINDEHQESPPAYDNQALDTKL